MRPRLEAYRSRQREHRRAGIRCPATSSAAFAARRHGRRAPAPPRTTDGCVVRPRPRRLPRRIAPQRFRRAHPSRGCARRLTRYPGATVDRYSRDAPRLINGVGELPDLPERGARLGKPRPELMPGVRDQWEDLEPYGYPGRSRTLGRPYRIVTQHLGVPGLE